MADVLKRVEYERLFGSIDTALEAYKAHNGTLSPLDQEVFIELRSLRMWLLSILRVTPSRARSPSRSPSGAFHAQTHRPPHAPP